jgi:hypothetical protein
MARKAPTPIGRRGTRQEKGTIPSKGAAAKKKASMKRNKAGGRSDES